MAPTIALVILSATQTLAVTPALLRLSGGQVVSDHLRNTHSQLMEAYERSCVHGLKLLEQNARLVAGVERNDDETVKPASQGEGDPMMANETDEPPILQSPEAEPLANYHRPTSWYAQQS